MKKSTGGLSAWLRLIRLPNLLTAPGDPLAGYLLAAGPASAWGPRLWTVLAASLLLYTAGLIMNDVADARVDARERPQRPIPSGAVDEMIARIIGGTLILFGLLMARYIGWPTALVATLLVGCIFLYNYFVKATAWGPLLMGLCRGLNLLMGASLVSCSAPLVVEAAGGLALYIMAVTLIARGEMMASRPSWFGWLPTLAVAVIVASLLTQTPAQGVLLGRLGLVLFLAFSLAGLAGLRLRASGRSSAPDVIGLLLSALLVLQAALCIASGAGELALGCGLALLLLWPLHRLLARFIPAS